MKIDKSDSYSVSNNLPYIYDAPSLNQNNDYKFYDNTSFGNNNKKRNNFSFKNKEEIKFNNPTIGIFNFEFSLKY